MAEMGDDEQRKSGSSKSLANLVLAARGASDTVVGSHSQWLEHFDAMILDVEAAEPPLGDATPSLMASIKRFRNSRLPAISLPTEILAKILKFSLQGDDPRRRRKNLARISSRFRSIVRDTPTLWETIEVDCPAVELERALERSGGVPLNVIIKSPAPEGNVSMIVPHLHRCKRLVVEENLSIFEQPLGIEDDDSKRLNLPLLESLELSSMYSPGPYGWAIRLPQAPSLRSVHLSSITTKWDASVLASLIKLNLTNVALPSLYASDVVQMMRSSPNLSELVLDAIAATPEHDEDVFSNGSRERIICTSLLRLVLCLNRTQTTVGILSCLHTPMLEVLRIGASGNPDPLPLTSLLSELVREKDADGVSLASQVMSQLGTAEVISTSNSFLLLGSKDSGAQYLDSMAHLPVRIKLDCQVSESFQSKAFATLLQLIACPTLATLRRADWAPELILRGLPNLKLVHLQNSQLEGLQKAAEHAPEGVPIECWTESYTSESWRKAGKVITENTGRPVKVHSVYRKQTAWKSRR